MNEDQKFSFNIVMQTLLNFINGDRAENPFELLRMVVTGTAGSGKFFLIKCLVKAIRTLFGSNKSVQVVCPIGNSANINLTYVVRQSQPPQCRVFYTFCRLF